MSTEPLHPNYTEATLNDPTTLNVEVPTQLRKAVEEFLHKQFQLDPADVDDGWLPKDDSISSTVLSYDIDHNMTDVQHALLKLDIPISIELANSWDENAWAYKNWRNDAWVTKIFNHRTDTLPVEFIVNQIETLGADKFREQLYELKDYCKHPQFDSGDVLRANEAAIRFLIKGAIQ